MNEYQRCLGYLLHKDVSLASKVLVPDKAWTDCSNVLREGIVGKPITITRFLQDYRGVWYPLYVFREPMHPDPIKDNVVQFASRQR